MDEPTPEVSAELSLSVCKSACIVVSICQRHRVQRHSQNVTKGLWLIEKFFPAEMCLRRVLLLWNLV